MTTFDDLFQPKGPLCYYVTEDGQVRSANQGGPVTPHIMVTHTQFYATELEAVDAAMKNCYAQINKLNARSDALEIRRKELLANPKPTTKPKFSIDDAVTFKGRPYTVQAVRRATQGNILYDLACYNGGAGNVAEAEVQRA